MKQSLIAAAAGVFAMAAQLPAGFACDPAAASGSSRQPPAAASSAYLPAAGSSCAVGSHWQDARYNHLGHYEAGHCVPG